MKPVMPRIITLSFLVLVTAAYAQSNWDSYIARYDAGLGSVQLDMALIHSTQTQYLPFLLITGVNCRDCHGDGFPAHRELKRLYGISDRANRQVFQSGLLHSVQPFSILAGSFLHQCQRLDYIYLADTVGIRAALERLYRKKFPRYTFHIRLAPDPEWDAYRSFLYPNDPVRIFMMNQRAIVSLNDAGDALSRPRFVEHLIYFDMREDREWFIRYIGHMNYDIREERDMHRDSLRYLVRLAKFGTVSLEEMNDQTTYLNAKAREFNGVYKGWVTKPMVAKQRLRLLYNPIAASINTAK